MIKRHSLFVCIILFVFRSLQISAEAASDRGTTAKYELVLLHTSDHHGAVLPNRGRGGLAEQAAYIKAVKTANKQVLLVDAGDFNTGSALSNMFDADPDILAFNRMGYDAGVFGNQEFDGSLAKLQRQMELADYPLLSDNIKTASGAISGDYLGACYLVKRYDGFTAGLFGITTLRALTIASPDKSLVFINEIEAAREGEGGVLKDLTIHRQPVDEDAVYRFVTNDYLLGDGDGYTVLTQAQEPFNTSLSLSYVVVEYIKAQSAAQDAAITPETDGRIAIIGGVSQ
ncbi:MAG: 5'-nucleotidase C-terminal domain-containing protein [Treponema sp.]|jgi:2',3'-cyclic-nucleotide 2'-phosphodiesterase (5'-nucleotidase family)|nr:5'-nucleotidase C-terminal domain-containing protein [Treponema sp.]